MRSWSGGAGEHDVPRPRERLPELDPEVGMRDADEQLRPLAERLAEQVDRAVLRDDPVHVASGSDHATTRGE